MALLGGWQIEDQIEGDTAELSSFKLVTKDAEGNPLKELAKNPFTVKVIGPDGKSVKSEMKELGEGVFFVEYQALVEGEHSMKVATRMDLPKMRAGAFAEKTAVFGDGVTDGKPQDNLPTDFTIESRDREGNKIPRGGDPYEVVVEGPSGDVPAEITDNGDGSYKVVYAPQEAGPHKVKVSLRNKSVAKSPYHVNVKEGADHRTSCVSAIVFTIQSKTKSGKNLDHGGEPFTAESDAPEWAFSDNGDGKYTGKVGAVPAGAKFQVNVKVNDQSIVGCPATFDFAAAQ